MFRELNIRGVNSMGAQKTRYSMCLNKILHYIVFIFAFVYLIMCPTVHQIGEDIRHDMTVKVEKKVSRQNPKSNLTCNPLKIVNAIREGISVYFRTLQELSVSLSSHSTLNLSRLSTVRLIL
jgi:hypothetical protein